MPCLLRTAGPEAAGLTFQMSGAFLMVGSARPPLLGRITGVIHQDSHGTTLKIHPWRP